MDIDDVKTVDGTLSVKYINQTIKIIHQRLDAYAVGDGIMTRSKFIDIVPQFIKDKMDDYKIALRDDEVLQLWNYKAKDEKDEAIKDIFLLNCVTGQRISDTEKVDDNLENILDVTTIKLVQKKTGKYLNFSIIFELAKEILNKYPNGLPNVSASTLNARIKEIAREAGITGKEITGRQTKDGLSTTYKERYECISSHTGRRTFITLLKLREWDNSKIMMYSGHRDDKMIKQYTKIKDTADFERFDKARKEHPEMLLKLIGETDIKPINDIEKDNRVILPQLYFNSTTSETITAYEIDRDIDISKYSLSEEEKEFLNKTCDFFEVGTPRLKIRNILNRLISLGIVVKLSE